ncbi:hypothetical protein DL768_004472 [Monosporascus sp. mg162]|nr:hypothetical protein DL768_004472 [Monosporascus sp. mg162]
MGCDVVRIAPNELVFVTPQALADLYDSHNKNLELFPKTQINNHGNGEHGGIIWEWDPVRHRKVAKQLSPAFSGRALRAKEPTLHRYIDLFVERMKSLGGGVRGPPPLKYLFLLSTAMKAHSHIRDHSRQQLEQRIRRKGAVEYLDFFEQLIPEDREPPKDPKEMRRLEQVAGQLLVAGYEPPAMWFYFTIYHLLKEPVILETLRREIRGAFKSYSDITSGAAVSLPYLTACLKESLRVMPNVLTGMPVVSPGAVADGAFIPKGSAPPPLQVICQSSPFALARSPRNFCEPLRFRPERWLPEEHPLYDTRFANDDRKGFHPFSQGPRMCAGKEIAWWQSRVFIAKVLWTFDLEMVSRQPINMDRDLGGWAGLFLFPRSFTHSSSDEESQGGWNNEVLRFQRDAAGQALLRLLRTTPHNTATTGRLVYCRRCFLWRVLMPAPARKRPSQRCLIRAAPDLHMHTPSPGVLVDLQLSTPTPNGKAEAAMLALRQYENRLTIVWGLNESNLSSPPPRKSIMMAFDRERTLVPFSEATKADKLDSHTCRVNLYDAFCIGAVPNGGYTVSCMLAAASAHLSPRGQPDTLTAHFEFPGRTAVGPAIVVVEDVKLTGQLSTLHLTLWQDGLLSQAPWVTPSVSRRAVLAYTTHTNLRTFAGITLPTGYEAIAAAALPPVPDFEALKTKNGDDNWEEPEAPKSSESVMRSLRN